MTTKKTLAQQWTVFELVTGIVETSLVQRRETRRAFYAGVASILDTLTASLDSNVEPTDDDLAYLDSIAAELKEFGEAVAAGLA